MRKSSLGDGLGAEAGFPVAVSDSPNIAPGGQTLEEAEVSALLRRADKLRDDREWQEAAKLYRLVLDQRPDLADIWVQYGHMLKESSQFDDAEPAYRIALDLDPENADTHLQLGHFYKLTGFPQKAIDAYAKSLELAPGSADPAREMAGLGAGARAKLIVARTMGDSAPPLAQTNTRPIYIDITDLMMFFGGSRTLTGIQRVITMLIMAASEDKTGRKIGFCMLELESFRWKRVTTESLTTLIRASIRGADTSDPVWGSTVGMVRRAITASNPLVFEEGSVLVNFGAPWGLPNYFAAIRDLKDRYHIHYVGFIHDVVPLIYPEYCVSSTIDDYTRWFVSSTINTDLLLANAENTKRDFERALAKLGGQGPGCEALRLDGDFVQPFTQEAVEEEEESEVSTLLAQPFVLFVGTIEPRKNHVFVLSAWKRMLLEFGEDKVPTLVLVGKLGWDYQPVLDIIARSPLLAEKVQVLNHVSDGDLAKLYRGCMFTVYNSHYEGWGLPVTESLAYHKVPVVPRHSSLTESGGAHAMYFESASEPSFLDAVKSLINNPQVLAERNAAIAASPPIRRWATIFDEFLTIVDRNFPERAGVVSEGSTPPTVKLGHTYQFRLPAEMKRPDLDYAIVEACRRGAGWHPLESWGVWTGKASVTIGFTIPEKAWSGIQQFTAEEAADEAIIVYLMSKGHHHPSRITVKLPNRGGALLVETHESEIAVLRIDIPCSAISRRQVILELHQSALTDLNSLTGGSDPRVIGIALLSMMICLKSDGASRLDFLERTRSDYRIAEPRKLGN